LLPPGVPEWLVAAWVVLATVSALIIAIAGPLRAAEALLKATAGVLHWCNEIRDEWRKLRPPKT